MIDQDLLGLMCCPRSGQSLVLADGALVSADGRFVYPFTPDDIPQCFVADPEDPQDTVTDQVKGFYEATPFPNYDDIDDIRSLVQKAKRSRWAASVDEQLPFNIRVLEVGCGTGQLTNYLSIPNRLVVGADMCLTSLGLGRNFARDNGLTNTAFIQMNLFHPVFLPESFDVVISTGVLHHTADPVGGFASICRLLKPGGFIVIGLYNKYGRRLHRLRRLIFRTFSRRLAWLDPYWRSKQGSDRQREAWYRDQYQHPHELTHTYGEVLNRWFRPHGVEFISAVPAARLGESFDQDWRLFEPHSPGTRWDRLLIQSRLMWTGNREGGFFLFIGRKR